MSKSIQKIIPRLQTLKILINCVTTVISLHRRTYHLKEVEKIMITILPIFKSIAEIIKKLRVYMVEGRYVQIIDVSMDFEPCFKLKLISSKWPTELMVRSSLCIVGFTINLRVPCFPPYSVALLCASDPVQTLHVRGC